MKLKYDGYLITRGGSCKYEIHANTAKDGYIVHKAGYPNTYKNELSIDFVHRKMKIGIWKVISKPSNTNEQLEPSVEPENTPVQSHLEIRRESTMNNTLDKYRDTLITGVTLVKGRDASTMTSEDFYGLIDARQRDISRLEKLEVKSDFVKSEVKRLKTEVEDLAKLMDETFSSDL